MAVAILSLGLGMGLNLTVFGVFESIIVRGVTAVDPAHTVHVWLGGSNRCSYPNFRDVRDSKAVPQLAGYSLTQFSIGDGDGRERIYGQVVTGDYFELLGVTPALGRGFTAEEKQPERGAQVALISYSFWRNRFHGDPDALGQVLRLNGKPFTMVGVLPEGYRSLHGFALALPFYVPYSTATDPTFRQRTTRSLELVARLSPQQTREQASAALLAEAKELERLYPKDDRGFGQARLLGVSPFEVLNRERGSQVALLFFAILTVIVGLILLMACANVAGLLIARAVGRRREVAVRLAVGAGRGQLIRLFLMESAVLSALGLLAAAILYVWAVQALGRIDLPVKEAPVELSPELNWRIALYCLFATAATALACGLGPALQAARANVSEGLKNEIASAARGRMFTLRNALVIGQVAVSLLLLVVSLLFVRSLQAVQTVDPGFNVANQLIATVRYDDPKADDNLEKTDGIIDALGKAPGVRSVSAGVIVPLSRSSWMTSVKIDRDAGRQPIVQANAVAPRYFETMGIRLLAGREFTNADNSGAPLVAIVNQAFAARYWPGKSPLGRVVAMGSPRLHGDEEIFEVVGVVADSKHLSLGEGPTPVMYFSFRQEWVPMGFQFHIRTGPAAADMTATVRNALRALEPHAAVDVKPMSENIELATMPNRIGAVLLGFMGALGLALASIGLYGVLAYAVGRRSREIGIRIALGASRSGVLRVILGQAMALVGIGAFLGVALSLAATRPLATFLSAGVSVTDPVSLVAVVAVLALTGLAAAFVPARRALRVDPMTALRSD